MDRSAPTRWLCQTILYQPVGKPNLIRFRIDRSNYARFGATLSQDVRMPIFLCAGNILDFHNDDDHIRLVSRTKLAKVGKPGSFAIGLQTVKCRLKPG